MFHWSMSRSHSGSGSGSGMGLSLCFSLGLGLNLGPDQLRTNLPGKKSSQKSKKLKRQKKLKGFLIVYRVGSMFSNFCFNFL